jgi:hypothetical protein
MSFASAGIRTFAAATASLDKSQTIMIYTRKAVAKPPCEAFGRG